MKRKILTFGLGGAILFFLGKNLYQSWEGLRSYSWDLNYLWLGLSCGLLAIYFPVLVLSWWRIVRQFEPRIALKRCFRIWLYSQLAKYLPGKVWFVLGRVYLCRAEGISAVRTSASLVLEIALILTSGLLVFAGSWALDPRMGLVGKISLYMALIPLALLIFPPVFKGILNFLLRLTGRDEIEIHLKYRELSALMALYLLSWGIYGTSFFCIAQALRSDGGNLTLPAAIGINAISWIIGFLVFLTPAGLGARESALISFLNLYLPTSSAILISFGARLVITAAELAAIGMVWLCGDREGLRTMQMLRRAEEGSRGSP